MILLLYIALTYLLITTVVLFINRIDFTPLKSVKKSYFSKQAPRVSICIPARNEAASIERCVRSAVTQEYPDFHVFVLDDESTDGTSEILQKLSTEYPKRLSIISGKAKPNDWLGKSWACHQLSLAARGEILVFIDADTKLQPQTTSRLIRTMGHDVVDFITIWPEQELGTFWERVIIPLIYFALLTLLPVRYVKKGPKWLPSFLKRKTAPLFAAACGQFMAFKREAYEAIGGHKTVKNKVVEDVEMAKNIKRAGIAMNMYHGQTTISCRMYTSGSELWEGFRKNFLAGFGYNIPFFVGMGLLHAITFILPILLLPILLGIDKSCLLILSLSATALIFIQRIVLDRWFNWNNLYSLLHPLGVFWFELLGLRVILDYLNNSSTQWKNRDI
ncbi:MAG: glycosyltransferase family 2 protein [Balneolaceae bacterium]|jgi:chlorobactene glucosyltransferase